jgi:hypothetical protein
MGEFFRDIIYAKGGQWMNKRKIGFAYLLLLPILILILIVVILFTIANRVPAYSTNFTNISGFVKSVRLCTDFPSYNAAPEKPARVVDLDPSIPLDSKATFELLLTDQKKVEIYFTTEAQIVAYLKELDNIDCFLGDAPPLCRMGNYPGQPSDRQPCIVPTPDPTTYVTPSATPVNRGKEIQTSIKRDEISH